MKITALESWAEDVPLTRPYTIARGTRSDVRLVFLRLVTDRGVVGLGSASPSKAVTGETVEECEAALEGAARELLVGRDVNALGANLGLVAEPLSATPGARTAVDTALYDVVARALGVPLVDFLGPRRGALPTSITIGIRSVEETLVEAREYLGRGFRRLKVKLGHDVEVDEERLRRLRETIGAEVGIRVDANEGYDLAATRRILGLVEELRLELVEQPLPRAAVDQLAQLTEAERGCIALDESLQSEADALRFAGEPALAASWVIKLMKCGGVAPALAIARTAAAGGRGLMWGCMDESAISISAALHAAYASPATRWLDLDGSFDLARDPARGGFELRDGALHLTDEPGLGVSLD